MISNTAGYLAASLCERATAGCGPEQASIQHYCMESKKKKKSNVAGLQSVSSSMLLYCAALRSIRKKKVNVCYSKTNQDKNPMKINSKVVQRKNVKEKLLMLVNQQTETQEKEVIRTLFPDQC